jgi:hypothetical protein
LLQEQVLSGWSQIMHMNSLAMGGDYRDFGFPAMADGRWPCGNRPERRQAEASVSRTIPSHSLLLFTIEQIGDISNEL